MLDKYFLLKSKDLKLRETRTNEPMDPRLLLQLSAKTQSKKNIYLNKMKEDYPRSFI